MRWILGGSFIGMAIWTLIPDKIEEEETQVAKHLGVFGATFITFFLAEMGDKTQIATVALAAHYAATLLVIAETTIGILIADVPAVFVGNKFAAKIPMKSVITSLMIVFAELTLSACSENLTAQAKKAAAEVAAEANKAATKKIEEAKNDAIGQLKELKGGTEAEKEEKGAQADSKTSE